MEQNSNIFPVHKALSLTGTDSTHTSFVLGASGEAAYTNMRSVGTTSTYTTTASSGYQYIGGGTPLIPVVYTATGEAAVTADSFSKFVGVTKTFAEYNLTTEFFFDGTKDLSEPALGADSLFVGLSKSFTEALPQYDQMQSGGTLASPEPVGDGLFVSITKIFNEYTTSTDSGFSYLFFDSTDTATVSVEPEFIGTDTNVISVSGFENTTDGYALSVTPTSLATVVNPSSINNPFLPTIIVGGVTYVTNPCTAPPPDYTVTSDTYWVNYLNGAIGNTNYCNLQGSNMTLDYSGGNFTITSLDPLGAGTTYSQNLGQTVQAYGFTGTITDFGKTISSNENFYVTQGTFGSINLSKPFALVTYGGSQYFSFLSSAYNLNAAPPINSYTTVRGMAQAIANICGITISWLIADGPYQDIFGQSGLTGLDALNTLAASMGGTLRWNGSNHYVVAYPDFFQGTWVVPDAKLLTSSGLRYSNHLDLGYGVSGAGTIGIPTNVFFDSETKTLPQTGASINDEYQIIASTTKALTSDDPPFLKDLPNDIIGVKAQILVTNPTFTAGRYITNNSSIWFDLGSASFANQWVKLVRRGGAFINQLQVDYNFFPDTPEIQNGNFIANFAIVRRTMQGEFEQAKEDQDLLLRQIQAKIAANVRFIKTYSGTISCYFYGSLPLPGMWASATYCGETVQGIVESVSLSGSGIVTVEVAQYFKINLLDRKLNIALTSGTYSNY